MASSRKRPPKPDAADSILLSALQRAVAQAHAACAPLTMGAPLLIAYSGGPDSTVLLDLACRLRDTGDPQFAHVYAVHVHHGLQVDADAWVEHCQQQCGRRRVPLTVCRVRVQAQRGVEDGARRARYAALAQAAQQAGAHLLLTAHNADDRIETFLLQCLRGAGLDGLAGIAGQRVLERAGPHPQVQLLRPLLEVTRRQIEGYLARHDLPAVVDPSNADPRFARNALRQLVLPPLAQIRSGYRKSVTRSIELIGEASEVLRELAQEGLTACTEAAPASMLRIDRLAALAPARRPLVLRAWLAQCGVGAPSRARLLEALEQALGVGGEGRMLIRIGNQELRRHRGLLCLRAAGKARRLAGGSEPFFWNGEPEVVVGAWGGVLRFVVGGPSEERAADQRAGAASGKSSIQRAGKGAGRVAGKGSDASSANEPGFDPAWLRQCPLQVRARTGGERFKPHALRPSKRLKHLFQEAGVPEFERAALPLLWRDGRLIFVAGLGGDARLVEAGPGRVRIEWSGEPSLLAG